MFGAASAEEVVDGDVLSFLSPGSRDTPVAAVLLGQPGCYRLEGVRLDGSTFPIEVTATPIQFRESGEARLVLVRDLSPVALGVDDEPPVARLTAALMRNAGYQTALFTSPCAAVAGYYAGAASVIVTDVRMPEMDGVAMVRRIREVDPEVPVVFMSGFAEVDVPRDELTAWLKKPFGIADLGRALSRLPARARATLE